jgi:hypothetical protein
MPQSFGDTFSSVSSEKLIVRARKRKHKKKIRPRLTCHQANQKRLYCPVVFRAVTLVPLYTLPVAGRVGRTGQTTVRDLQRTQRQKSAGIQKSAGMTR